MKFTKHIRGFLGATVILLATANTSFAENSIVILPWKYNGPPESSYISGAMSDMFFSRIASVEGLSATKGAKEASTINDALKAVGTGADYVFFGSLSSLGSNISIDGQLVWIKSKTAIPFSVSGSGVDSLVGLADSLAGQVSSSIRGDVAPLSMSDKGEAEVTYNGRFNNQVAVVQVAPKEKEIETKPVGVSPTVTPIGTTTKAPPVSIFIAGATGATAPQTSGGVIQKPKSSGAKKDFIFKSPLKKEFMKSIATADLNGDGQKEIITISSRKIYIDSYSDGKLVRQKEIKEPRGTNHLSISVMPVDGDTKEVVHIASLLKGRPSSKVLAYLDGEYKITNKNIKYITAVLNLSGTPALIGQKYKHGRGFFSSYHILDDSFNSVGELDLPKGLTILALKIADFTGDGLEDIVALDSNDYLRLYEKQGTALVETWKSSDKFGGSLDKVNFIKSGANLKQADSVAFSNGFKLYDLDGDSQPEIVSRANEATGFFGQFAKEKRRYTNGKVVSLSFDGAQMTTNWETKVMQGYIADFTITDIDQDGREDILLLLLPKGKAGTKAQSQIIAYRLL